ncbi:MAG: hypothetical protein ACI4T5_02490 [Prevotella sp.]
MAENVNFEPGTTAVATGTAGLGTQLPGSATTVGSAAAAGGMGGDGLIQHSVDEQIMQWRGDLTPLTTLASMTRTVEVNSPIVDHYMMDEPRHTIHTSDQMDATTGSTLVLKLVDEDAEIPRTYQILVVMGVNGYNVDKETPCKPLQLIVTGRDTATGMPIVRATNGKKKNATDAFGTIPMIPAGAEIKVLANAVSETRKWVDPDSSIPSPDSLYLQKRVVNRIVSDYFDAQEKRVPYDSAMQAELILTKFKIEGNLNFWASQQSSFKVDEGQMGPQTVYTTMGIRWQFKRQLNMTGKWTFERVVAMMKLYYTGQDVPSSCIMLCGKNFLESIQCIDFSEHPEVTMEAHRNEKLGWSTTLLHTVFGDAELKREPALDELGWSNSAALIGEDRLVRYVYKSEQSFSEEVEGHEAKREGTIIWDGIALKGYCHMWIDGESTNAKPSTGIETATMWEDSEAAPATTPDEKSVIYVLLVDCPSISTEAVAGTYWQWDGSKWTEVDMKNNNAA